MSKNLGLNTSYKPHFFVGLCAGIWIMLFLVFIGPFDTAPLPIAWRAQVMYVYGLIFMLSYLITIPLQNLMYSKVKKWHWGSEAFILSVSFTISFFGSFTYYQSDIIRGDFSMTVFFMEVFFPTAIILYPLLIIARWYIGKLKPQKKSPSLKEDGIDIEVWKQSINRLLEEKVFLNPELSLTEMAQLLNTNNSVLSKVINQGYGLNFNDYINQHRIEAIVEVIKTGKHKTHTLSGIAEDCGFSSKATFNRAFKKHFGISPREYIQQIEAGIEI